MIMVPLLIRGQKNLTSIVVLSFGYLTVHRFRNIPHTSNHVHAPARIPCHPAHSQSAAHVHSDKNPSKRVNRKNDRKTHYHGCIRPQGMQARTRSGAIHAHFSPWRFPYHTCPDKCSHRRRPAESRPRIVAPLSHQPSWPLTKAKSYAT